MGLHAPGAARAAAAAAAGEMHCTRQGTTHTQPHGTPARSYQAEAERALLAVREEGTVVAQARW